MPELTEDDLYRTSTQYRLWSFNRESLLSLRFTTNESAAEGVRAALHTQKAAEHEQSSKQDSNSSPPQEVDCLSVDEEQKLVVSYCVQTMRFADFCEFPTNVKARSFEAPLLPTRAKLTRCTDARLQLSNTSSASTSLIRP